MAKIYTKGSTVVDEILAGSERYDILENGGGAFKAAMQINLATGITQAGTIINAARLNNIENGIDALDTLLDVVNSNLNAGWFSQTETWTYNSTTSFKVSGDRTAFYTKGRRLRWKHATTYRYGIVSSSSYSAPDTTVTILGNADYPVANSAISSPGVSDLDNPVGWPDWFTWQPTYSASGSMTFTGATTQTTIFRVVGRTVFFMIRVTGTTGGTAGLEVRASAPVTPVALTGQYFPFRADVVDTTLSGRGMIDTTGGILAFLRADGANWGLGASKAFSGEGWYQW